MSHYSNNPKPSTRGKKSNPGKPDFRFINYSLSEDDKQQLLSYDVDVEFNNARFDDLVDEGYKITFSHDAAHNTYIASMTDRTAGSPWENSCLTARGSTMRNACISLLFKHYALAEEDWVYFANPENVEVAAFD